MADPNQPTDPTTGMPPAQPANKGKGSLVSNLPALNLGLQTGPDGKPLLDADGLPILAPPSAEAMTPPEKPVTSQTIEPGVAPETPAPEVAAMAEQRAGERQPQQPPIGQEQVVGTPDQNVAQASTEEVNRVQRVINPRQINEPARPNAQSTSEQVRGLANRPKPIDVNKALKEGVTGAVADVGAVATGEKPGVTQMVGKERQAGLGERIVNTALAAANVPSDVVGRTVADSLKQSGMAPEQADQIGMAVGVMASVAYGASTPIGLGMFTKAEKLPSIGERLLTKFEHAGPDALTRALDLEAGRAFGRQASVNYLLDDVKYSRLADNVITGLKESGGATVHPTLGPEAVGPDKAAVSVVPSRSVIIEGRQATRKDALDFAKGNQDLLDKYPGLRVGAWEDKETGKTHFDLSVITDPERAHVLGAVNRQKAIFLGSTQDSERVHHVFDAGEGPHGHGYTPSEPMRPEDIAVAKEYDRAPMLDEAAVPAWRELISFVKQYTETNILPKLQVEYVSGQPYANHTAMNADIAAGRLKVSKDYADHPVWTPEENLLFRVWHDYEHHFLGGSDFSLHGEWLAAQRAVEGAGVSSAAKKALSVEVYGQASAAIAHAGEFQPQKIYIPGKKYRATDVIEEQLKGLGLVQMPPKHSPLADTLEAAAAEELADVPRGTAVYHGTGATFEKPDMMGGLWVAEKPETAGTYATRRAAEAGEGAAQVRPYYLDPTAKLADRATFDRLAAEASNDPTAMANALAAEGYDGVAFTDDLSRVTGKGNNFWIINPLVLAEKFTGQTAAMLAMAAGAAAGAAAGGEEDRPQGAMAGAAAGLVFKKGGRKVLADLSRAEELAKSAQGGLRYLTRPVDWAAQGKNSKPVNALANVAAAMIARGEVSKPEEILAALVGRYGDGVLHHADVLVEKAQANFEKALKGVDLRPVEDVQRFFAHGNELPDWYASGERIRQVFGPDAELVAGLIAATSAHNSNERSIEAALHIYAAGKTGKFDLKDPASMRAWFANEAKTNPDFRGWTMATHAPNIERAMLGQELSGNKVSNYLKAILGDEDAVVIDSHMVNALIPAKPKKGFVDINGEQVPDWVAEIGPEGTAAVKEKDWVKAAMESDAVYSFFEGVTRKFAAENGVTPRYAQQAIWTGRVAYEGRVKESVQVLPEMFTEVAMRRGYDKLFPSMSEADGKGLQALGAATVLLGISAAADRDGGVTMDHVEAGMPGLSGNKAVMKVVLEAVRKLRQVPGKAKVIGAVDPTKALDVLTHPEPAVRVGDKLLGMDWVGMSQDADHLPQTIKIVQSVFEDAIRKDSRGVVTHDMERQMAETMVELGFDPESAVAKWKEGGRAVVSTEIMAVAALTKASYDETRRLALMATKYEGDARGARAMEEFGRALGVFSSLAVTLGGQAEESGRALGVFRALVPDIPKEALAFGRKQAELEAKGLTPGARAAAAGGEEAASAAARGAENAPGVAGTGAIPGSEAAARVPGAAPAPGSSQAPSRAAQAGAPSRPPGTGAPKPGFQGPPGPSAVAGAMAMAQQQAQQQAAQYLVTMLQAWNQLPTSKQQGIFIREVGKFGLDMIKELFYSSMLFTFPGQIANLAGSGISILGEELSKFAGIGIGKTLEAMGRQTPPMALNEITDGTFAGMMGSIGEAFVYAGKSFLTGMPESRDIMGASMTKTPRALSGERVQDVMATAGVQIPNAVYHGVNVLGMTVGAGARAMMSSDEFMKTVAFRGELQRLAVVEQNKQGLTGAAGVAFVKQYLQNPPAEDIDAARKYAHYVTFTSPMEGTLAAISKVGKSTLMLPFTPFFDTLANIFKYDLEWTPLAPFVKKVREDLKTPGPRQDQALAKIGIGSAMLAFAGWVYMNGGISGPGPTDKNILRDMKEIEKYQPNSFVMRDAEGKKHYFGFNRFDPIAFPFAFAGAYGDIALEALNGRAVSLETLDELAIAGAIALGEVAQTRNYFQGFQKTLEIALSNDPKNFNKLAKVGQQIAGQVVPSGVAQINRNVDENVRAVYSMMDAIYQRLPGYSKTLPVDVNLKGDPKFKTAALGPDFMSPIPYSKGEPSPVIASWRQNGVSIAAPGRSIFGPPPPPLVGEETAAHGIMLDPKQQQRYEMLAGNHLKVKSSTVMDALRPLGFQGELPESKMGMWDIQEALLKSKKFLELEPATQGKVQRAIVMGFRKAAQGELLREDKPLREKFLGKVLDRAELYAGARGRAMAEKAMQTANIDQILEQMGEGGF